MALPLRGLALATSQLEPLRTKIAKEASSVVLLSRRPVSVAPRTSSSTAPRHPTRHFHTSPTSNSNSSPQFTYGIAASFIAKDQRYHRDRNNFSFNPYNVIVRRRKDKSTRPASGQDAFFVSRIGEGNDVAFGVADGVGGWADSGVDPSHFSHGICDYMAHAAYTYRPGGALPPYSARSLLQRGYEDIHDDETVPFGGSTACVAIAKTDGTLEVANLGDSGFMQLRLNAIHNYSEPQTHSFNAPYQLSVMPKAFLAREAAFGGLRYRDMPKDANVSKHSLRHGDVLVFATDGVWDNLSGQDVLRVVSRIMVAANAWKHTSNGIRIANDLHRIVGAGDGSHRPEERLNLRQTTSGAIVPRDVQPSVDDEASNGLESFIAAGLAREAKAASINTKKDGPFAKEIQKRYPFEYWRGGKVDDICVVVAIVVEEGK